MNAKLVSVVFVGILVACSCGGIVVISSAAVASGASAGSGQAGLKFVPLNPAFIVYEQNVSSGKASRGFVPPPIDLSQLKGQSIRSPLVTASTLPSSYDLRPNGVTPVKNQGSCGDCWAFGTYASLESYLKKNLGQTWDFSEANIEQQQRFRRRILQRRQRVYVDGVLSTVERAGE